MESEVPVANVLRGSECFPMVGLTHSNQTVLFDWIGSDMEVNRSTALVELQKLGSKVVPFSIFRAHILLSVLWR